MTSTQTKFNGDQQIVGTIDKNQVERVAITLSQYQGRNLIDVRTQSNFHNQGFNPTQKGISLPIERIDELIIHLQNARVEAKKNGWLKG